MTARVAPPGDRRRGRLRVGDRRPSATSSAARRSIPTGTAIFETRVDRATRADLGIWRRPLDGRPAGTPVLDPIAADDRFGRTFSTEFAWDVAGDRLAVQSCGEVACRTRVLAPGGGPPATLDDPDLGLLVGFDGDRLVTYAACRGLPCPIVSTDLRTRRPPVLAPAAGPAVVVATPDGARLVHEVGAGSRPTTCARSRSTAGRDRSRADPRRPSAPSRRRPAGGATRLPAGWVLLAPDGRLPADASTHRPQLRHIPDGTTVPLDEALR